MFINKSKGDIYIVATPIGNMEDITFRAIKILSLVDLILAEDTRFTINLLNNYKIKNKLLSVNNYNENIRVVKLIERINSGLNVALVSNAGTPLISDPGFKLVSEAINNSIRVLPVPGPSSLIASISVSGLSTTSFLFLGFPNKKKTKRLKELKEISLHDKTIVFFESAKRIISFLNEIMEILGDRHIIICREITKIYEEIIRGKISLVLSKLKAKEIKGEITLLISGIKINKDKSSSVNENSDIISYIKKMSDFGDFSTLDLSKEISNKYKISRTEVYNLIIKIREGLL